MDRKPCQARETLRSPRGPWFPKESAAKGAKVCRPALLPAFVRTRGDWSFLHERVTGPQRLMTSDCWWCNCGKRQSRHHLFTECKAWTPQIRELWRRVGKDCGWEHPRAPALRWLWKDDAVGAVVGFLESTRVGSRASAEAARARMDEDRVGEEAPGQESEEDGPGPP